VVEAKKADWDQGWALAEILNWLFDKASKVEIIRNH
jgi:hypothetical protein